LLEAGAIDGARGILINITGSSSLKLSEVNEASSLIQSASHEDASIIFGAVLDERMGEEVKITVIATGFRDQMPERRARMLTVEDAPVVAVPLSPAPVPSVPLVAVPLLTPDNWLREPAPGPVLAPAPRRFLSQDEEEREVAAVPGKAVETENEGKSVESGWHEERGRFSASAPAVDSVAKGTPIAEPAPAVEAGRVESEDAPAPPRFAELSEEPAYSLLHRDFASVFAGAPGEQDSYHVDPELPLASEAGEEENPDLDKPTFLRRFLH
jgi:cell division protein FtsZ